MVCDDCEKRIRTTVTPDVYKGGRNEPSKRSRAGNTGTLIGTLRPMSKSEQCDACSVSIHVNHAKYCQSCSHALGCCFMCGKALFDTGMYEQKGKPVVGSKRWRSISADTNVQTTADAEEEETSQPSHANAQTQQSMTAYLAKRAQLGDPDRPAFLPVNRFFGQKPGYYFGRDQAHGIGYHLDPVQHAQQSQSKGYSGTATVTNAHTGPQLQYASHISRSASNAKGWTWLPHEQVYYDDGLNVSCDMNRRVYIDHDANRLVPLPPPTNNQTSDTQGHQEQQQQHTQSQSQRSLSKQYANMDPLVHAAWQPAVSLQSLQPKSAGKRSKVRKQ